MKKVDEESGLRRIKVSSGWLYGFHGGPIEFVPDMDSIDWYINLWIEKINNR